ncbi:protein MON2 homolog isoform X2 [Actinia tenebrosa]|uniref:Protein MON2 homolog n=1 Tax=Actinia tenebrosa TaxID=6105 RepID=A0A6P8IVB2_ACTTE|nr:protein MON2 homolog isoform X1 [Actinia tenebrosa]XP_031571221.1 protein MON2 homolog isoform X2 [Actinia tenebrosa]
MSRRTDDKAKKFVDSVFSDLRALSNETKRKFHPVKEAAEAGIQRLKSISARNQKITTALAEENEILQPFLLGCDTKSLRVIQISLTALQRLITNEALSEPSANNLVSTLWNLMESGLEELRILQTVILLITTSNIVHGDHLGKAMALCFRLYFVKDSTVSGTAAATVRQMVSVVFDRVVTEDSNPKDDEKPDDVSNTRHKNCPVSLHPCARDAYLLFQDLCQLTSGEQPYWLHGVVEMTRTFGLELLESVLRGYPHIFLKHPEFSFLLKERVCPLIIKLFSPSIKYRQGGSQSSPGSVERPVYPVAVRLLRIVSVLIEQFYTLLVTECEIFLSLLVKFLDSSKPLWQRALALEVLHTLTIQPALLRSFCQFYDMQEHSTKIFHNIVNALSSFIQSLFTNQLSHGTGPSSSSSPSGNTIQTSSSAPPPSVMALSTMGGVTPQPGFLYRGAWVPLTVTPVSGQAKPVYLDHLEKQETPSIPDGYTLSIAFACILEIVKGLNTLVVHTSPEKPSIEGWIEPDVKHVKESDTGVGTVSINAMDQGASNNHVGKEMVNASWCGVLASLSLLLESSNDETGTEAILKSFQMFSNVCGVLSLTTPRDAFITSLCKAALPPHYTLTIVNPHSGKAQVSYIKNPSSSHGMGSDAQGGGGSDQPVLSRTMSFPGGGGSGAVVTGTSVGGSHGPVSLTAKNVQCMRALLSLAHCHGTILGTAWHMVLITLQHLTWILGLKPSTGGTLKAMPTTEAPNLVISQSMMAELPVLAAILSRLFETSQYLDDVALHHLVDALCQLSSTSMEQAQSNKEPSLFAVAKLLETGLNNLHRARILWKPLTAHLLEVCQHTHAKMREWGAEAVTSLVRSALTYNHKPPLNENISLQAMLLSPLQEMSSISYSDIRYKQLECVLQILHSTGQNLGHGWPCVLGVIGAATNQQGEGLIRVAFQSLQLVVTDFLPLMPCACLKVVIDVAGKFGLQPLELNISLTAIGLLWNIADFLSQNRDKIREGLKAPDSSEFEGLKYDRPVPPSDRLWMCLYSKLGDLCVDPRPAVRKSAGQTLFSTISVHGSLLENITWYTVLWQVLFPLLDQVKRMSTTAATVPPPSDINQAKNKILIHHSRDTAEKQWAETRVLTLNGVARVFNTRRQTLAALDEFPRAWALLLEFVESAALSKSSEVALAALKSFQEMVQDSSENSNGEKEEEDINMLLDPVRAAKMRSRMKVKPKFYEEAEDLNLWINAWKVWCDIGMSSLSPSSFDQTRVDAEGKTVTNKIYPTQPYITALVQIFPTLFRRIYNRFGLADLQKLSKILQACITIPVPADQSPFLLPSFQDTILTPLQHSIIDVVDILREPLPNNKGSVLDISSQPMYPTLFGLLVFFVECACNPPKVDNEVSFGKKKEWLILQLTPFSEKCLEMTVEMYGTSVNKNAVIQEKVLEKIIKALRTPMGLKYDCPSQTTWKLAVSSLLTVLRIGLPVALNNPDSFSSMWYELASCLEDFLFSEKTPPNTQSLEQHQQDEELDIKLLRMIREDILPHSSTLPKDFMVRVMALLNRGSIHSATDSAFSGTDANSFPIREEFAKSCFETLLQFSFVNDSHRQDVTDGQVSELALDAMLSRCQDVLEKYVEDERLSGKCPLPRTRMAEMSFVMKAVSTLIGSLKKMTRDNARVVDPKIWDQVVQLYPRLVECSTCNSNQVRRALKEALQEYADLLVAPRVDKAASGSLATVNGST